MFSSLGSPKSVQFSVDRHRCRYSLRRRMGGETEKGLELFMASFHPFLPAAGKSVPEQPVH